MATNPEVLETKWTEWLSYTRQYLLKIANLHSFAKTHHKFWSVYGYFRNLNGKIQVEVLQFIKSYSLCM